MLLYISFNVLDFGQSAVSMDTTCSAVHQLLARDTFLAAKEQHSPDEKCIYMVNKVALGWSKVQTQSSKDFVSYWQMRRYLDILFC